MGRPLTGLVILGTLLAAAQDRPETVIRTTTRLVEIRVMAEDASGNPVTDLRRGELQLEDNRQPRPIAFLDAEGSARPAAAANTPAYPQPNAAAAAVRDDYAMILLDWLNPRYADRLVVTAKVRKLLTDYRPRQQVALYLLGQHSGLLHDFTADPAELIETLANTPMEPEDLYDPARPRDDDPRFAIWAAMSREDKIARFNSKVLDTTGTLEKLADRLASVPGRKSLIWVTNGFPIVLDSLAIDYIPTPQRPADASYRENAERLLAHLNRANVALYTVDARGLPPPAVGSGALHVSTDPSYGDVQTMQELSARTGGTAFYNRNDLDEGMRAALEDSRVSYTLGFTLESGDKPGLHQIRLTTTRAGVKLRYRESYQWER